MCYSTVSSNDQITCSANPQPSSPAFMNQNVMYSGSYFLTTQLVLYWHRVVFQITLILKNNPFSVTA